MINREANPSYALSPQTPHTSLLEIFLSASQINSLYRYMLQQHQKSISTYGFEKGSTPLSYIETTFKTPVVEYLKEFFFNHYVFSELIKCLIKERPILSGEPQLCDIWLDPYQGGKYIFQLHHAVPEVKQDWKKVSFKAPPRKNYKDLDRQVEFFLKDETHKSTTAGDEIMIGDWVCFDLAVTDAEGTNLIPEYAHRLWLKMSDEETDQESFELFKGKKLGESFLSQNRFFQHYVSPQHDCFHYFLITIVDINRSSFFSFDYFKRHFKLKGTKDLHHKLIEVFSYRNDISQRRETAESALKLLRDIHYFMLAPDLISRQQALVLEKVQENPDYHVYKSQPEFKKFIQMLAEKQLKEAVIIDHICKSEQVCADHEDIMGYFNLIKRPRMKEFIYFDVPMKKIGGQEQPLSYEMVRLHALREKTLNHIIHTLMKR